MNKQNPEGFWGEGSSTFYLPKYRATFWTFFTLALLAADGEDERLRQTCHDAVVGCLMVLSEIPKVRRTKEIKCLLEQASEHMLKHHIYKRSHDLNQISIPNWLNLGMPVRSDFLGVLLILAKLGYKDRRMQDAIDLLLSKQNENGRWLMEQNYYRKFHTYVERKGNESKWITLRALTALKRFYESS